MRLLIALVVWVAAVAGAVAIGTAVEGSVSSSATPAAALSGGAAAPSGGSFDASAVKATDSDSLFRSANLGRALAAARAQLGPGARLVNFALYPGYLSLTAVKGSGEVDFYVNAAGTTNTVNTPSSPGGEKLFSLSRVDASAPALLAHRSSVLAHIPEVDLHYMVLEPDPLSGGLSWLIYPRPGTSRVEYFQASGARAPIREQLP